MFHSLERFQTVRRAEKKKNGKKSCKLAKQEEAANMRSCERESVFVTLVLKQTHFCEKESESEVRGETNYEGERRRKISTLTE